MTKNIQLNGKTYPVWLNQKGYACVTINENGKDRAYLLHRLVWERENGKVPGGYELHHKDGDKSNWRVENLLPVDKPTHQEIHRQMRSTMKKNKAGTTEKDKNPNRPGD